MKNLLKDSKCHFFFIFSKCQDKTRGCVTLWPCHLHKKSISRKKKNYGKSNTSPCKNTIFKKPSKRNQNPSKHYISVTNLKFQHKPKSSSFKNPLIKIDPLPRGQNPLGYYTLE
jgi:hypothetical protein